MDYLIIENSIITNVIVADESFAISIGAKPYYDGAEIGNEYNPPRPEPTTEEISLELHADHEYRLCMIELGLK